MNTVITECVNAILTQTRCGENFRPDLTKYVEAVYKAGQAEVCQHVHAEPLSEAEIAAFRDYARTAPANR